MEVYLRLCSDERPCFHILRVYNVEHSLPGGSGRSYFWYCPLACRVPWYKSRAPLHFPEGKTAAEALTTVPGVTASVLLQA